MPPNQEDKIRDVPTPDSEISLVMQPLTVTTLEFSSISSLSDHDESPYTPAIYETMELPQEPTLKELVQRASNSDDVSEITKVKLSVIACDVSLQHLSYHTPLLRELTLDGSILSSLRDLGCGLKSLKVLRVNRCSLTTLDGTFGLESLEEMCAAKNRITDISPCSNLPYIKKIDASNNFIRNVNSLYFLSLCENLQEISLEGNADIVATPDYRKVVKELLPRLTSLDGTPLLDEECPIQQRNQNSPSPAGSFLPLVPERSRGNELTNNNSFVVTFPPKVLSPLGPVTSSTSSSIHVRNVQLLPKIVTRQGSSRKELPDFK